MKHVSIAVFAMLVCSAHSLQNQFKEEKKYFNTFLDQVVGTGFQMDVFIDIMWPTIQDVLPGTVALPATEVFDPVTDQYMCVTNTSIHPRLGEIIAKKQVHETPKIITYEVVAELLLEAPVEMAVATSLDADKPPVHVSYSFTQPSKVKFTLEIVNFLNVKNVTPPGCVIRIKEIHLVRLSRPEVISKQDNEPAKKIEEFIRSNFKNGGAKGTGTAGLVRAVKEWITATPNYWICSSKYFDRMDEVAREKWEYSDNYNRYCLKMKKN